MSILQRRLAATAAVLATASIVACVGPPHPSADEFAQAAEERLLDAWIRSERANWIQATYITDDTTQMAAEISEELIATQVELAAEAARYRSGEGSADTSRKLDILRSLPNLPAPADAELQAELAQIAARLESTYGSGRYCPDGADGRCMRLGELEDVLDDSRDPEELLRAWAGWRTVSPAMRADYERYVELANAGATDLGFDDFGAMGRSGYDMSAEDFAAEVDRLWGQVSPLYESLHCHVRASLAEHYGPEVVDPSGPIPAHLLGNMWAQSWANVYDLVAPAAAPPTFDLTERLEARGYDPIEMVRTGEAFFTSLGIDPLPETFWERSQLTQPADRDVVCHASAWDVDYDLDLRIKMCIDVNAEDFQTIHHELGHNVYQAAYRELDPLFRDSANDGFHEALGDTVALSLTPSYLRQIGLIDQEPPAAADLSLLLRMALDKVAFLPFGLLVDQWRWLVYAGEVGPDQYNEAWWQLREDLQGVAAPSQRTEEHFDPGAKYHVPANVSYTRYFLAHILQFQLHRDLCAAIGDTGPLHRCSIYGQEEAGRRLREMMAMGRSRPWPEALQVISGGDGSMDVTAILDYFAPLQQWLDEQNEGRQCGW